MTPQEALGIENEDDVAGFSAHPTLYGKTSTGKIKQWTVGYFVELDGTAILRKRHGQVGGSLQNSDKKVKAVNVGKSNERDPQTQAKFEAAAAHKKQLDVGMQDSIEKAQAHKPNLPMLVHTYKDNMGKITFPAYLQPKLNGVRCLTHLEQGQAPQFISRKNQRYETVDHIGAALREMGIDNITLDGEIYTHGWSFAKVLQRVKKQRVGTDGSDKLQYWVYDIADEAIPYEMRHNQIDNMLQGHAVIVKCPTVEVHNDDQVWKIHDEWVKLGFEGAIIRNKHGMYQKGLVRSYDVMRVKNFHDAEFEIIGGKSEEVKLEDETWVDCVVYRCKTETGQEFDVRPVGSVEARVKMFANLKDAIGKPLTVKYAEFSEDGIPIFPVGMPEGLAIRDYE